MTTALDATLTHRRAGLSLSRAPVMAPNLGNLFLTAAMGPPNYAGQCIVARKVPEGLRELTRDSLLGAVRRGVATLAREVGVAASDIERQLPMAELAQRSERIEQIQQRAVEEWKRHTGHLVMEGIADLTVDGRPPDVSLSLMRLAKKWHRDKALAGPLDELSDEMDRWTELVQRCRDVLDDGDALQRAYQRKRLKRVAAAAVAGVLVLVAASLTFRVLAARARVEEVLAGPDPCTAGSIDESDLARGSDEQRARAAERVRTCQEARELAEREAAAAEQARRDAEAEALRKKQRLEACAALGEAVTAGKLGQEHLATAGEAASLLERVVKNELLGPDVQIEAGALPCADTDTSAVLARAFALATMASLDRWMRTHHPSPTVRVMLAKHQADLPGDLKRIFANRVEDVAERALKGGDAEKTTRAAELCTIKKAFEIPSRGPCLQAINLHP